MSLFVVSKKDDLRLVSNHSHIKDLEYKVENTHAAYEIRRLIVGTPYTMAEIGREVAENELLYKEADPKKKKLRSKKIFIILVNR